MVGGDDVRARGGRALKSGGGRVQRHEDARHLGRGVPDSQADAVPRLGPREREPVIERGDEVADAHLRGTHRISISKGLRSRKTTTES